MRSTMHEASHYQKFESGAVRCMICPKNCTITEGKAGFCGVRKNTGGKLELLNYARPCAMSVDPIEKKPLYHFLPGKPIFSISTVGCNLDCKHCQNFQIARGKVGDFDEPEIYPETIVELAKMKGCDMIAYTYTEPTIFYEYMIDTAKIAKEHGLKNVMVTNGYINPEPLKELLPFIDGANVDLKSFDPKFYNRICLATLDPVLETIKMIHEQGVWLEITNLVIPGENDDMRVIRDMVDWIKDELGPDVPLHFSRFHPMHKMEEKEPTPKKTLEEAYEVAKKKLNHVYLGNLKSESGQHTICSCGEKLILRSMIGVANNISEGKCPKCRKEIQGVWQVD